MRSTRARSRFAVVAVLVPVTIAGAPFVAPAFAASATVSVYSSNIGENNVVGPNAGFRNVAQGVRGSSAVFKVDTAASATLNGVEVRLSGFSTGPALVPDRDFAADDGFAVWRDVSGTDGTGSPDGVFNEIDYARGKVSTGYVYGTPSGGQIPVRIAIDGAQATATERYFVTVHPGSGAGTIENRDFKLTLPANGIRFSDSSLSPANAVETQKLTIDSKPPVAPATTSFAPVNRPAMARQAEPKKEDAYNVSPAEYNDADKTLVFLNDGNNVTEGNFLRHVGGTPAIYTLPQTAPVSAQELTIGDGTGVTATVKVANNNQVNDDVYVRAFDKIGNLTSAIRLTAGGVPGDTVDRSNDVTAPTFTAGTLDLNGARGVNASNVTAAPTRVQWSAPGTGSAAPTVSESRMVLSVGGTLTDTATSWKAGGGTTPAVITHDTTGVGGNGSQLAVQARLTDAKGNTSDVWRSTGTFLKDTVRPSLSSVAFLTDAGNDGQGGAGDKVRVTFSESMYKPGMPESGDINSHLDFPDAAVDWGFSGTGAQDPPTFTWDGDGTALTITLGSQMPPLSTNRLPNIGDKVRALATVQDEVGNTPFGDTTLSDRFIAALPPIPLVENIRTGDVGGRNLYNQGRDGQLDRLTVTFPHPIENANVKVPENLGNFTIIGSDVQKPTAVTVTSSTSFTLTFGGAMLSGETPLLQYTPTAEASLRAGGVDVPAFTRGSSDYAAPALRLLTTSDSTANGKLDTLVATYSEAVALASEPTDDNCDYNVPGYGNTGGPTDCLLLPQGTNIASQGPTPNVIHIELTEVASPDTHVTPGASTAGSYRPTDTTAQENASGTAWGTGNTDTPTHFNRVLDKAPPTVVSRTTRDLNSDGRLDAIDVVYTETLDPFSIENARYAVANRTVTSVDVLGSTGVRVNIAPIAPGRYGDTDALPTIQYTPGPNGGLADASDQRNAVRADAAPVAATDGAGPAITSACAGTASNNGACPVDTATDDKMHVFFSEAVSGVAAADFVVEQPAATNKAVTAAAVSGTDTKMVVLTLANNAIDQTKDALVRLSAANVVTDSGARGNTQTTAVTAPAAPAVKLDLICPVTSPGADPRAYCGQSTINTGAVATSGLVRFWRLATTAPTATTPDSEYSPNYPSSYPPSGTLAEGSLTLYLSGKDDFGRVAGVSPVVSDSITILRAPDIANVSIINTTTPARGTWGRSDTVVDGDNINVRATAFSNDVESWTSGGKCLAKHMSIDYRGITANGSLGAVAPFSCDLDTTSFRKSRKMTFPFVKVVGTTRYPVGTVLKQSANDPGWLIVDGPDGRLWRRQFVSVNARRSHQILDASVITVPVSVLNGYPRWVRQGYRDGSVIKASTSGYYYVFGSIKRPISAGLLNAWKIPLSQTYNVSTTELNAHSTGAGFSYGAHPLGTWIRFGDGSINQITRNRLGQVVRRGVTSSWALRTLVPGAQIYAANHYDRAVPFDATFTRGYRDGIMVKVNSTTYGVVSRTVLRTFTNATTFNTLGYNTSNAWPYSPSYLPRTPGGFTTGTPIDRYKITSVIVKVTNLAGGTATRVVLPTVGGLWGVGTLDPKPSNWDNSRQ